MKKRLLKKIPKTTERYKKQNEKLRKRININRFILNRWYEGRKVFEYEFEFYGV